MLKINQEKCKKCQICAKNCPIGAIAVEPGADGKKVVSITNMFRTSLVPACISRSGFIENSRLAPAFRISSLSMCLSIIRRIAGSRPSGVTPGANRTYPR